MSPKRRRTYGQACEALKAKYGSHQGFMDEFEGRSQVFGSGWAWLQPDLSITTTLTRIRR